MRKYSVNNSTAYTRNVNNIRHRILFNKLKSLVKQQPYSIIFKSTNAPRRSMSGCYDEVTFVNQLSYRYLAGYFSLYLKESKF